MADRATLERLAARYGLRLAAVADAEELPGERARMEASLAAGHMARMEWMGGERPALATAPRLQDPAARSVAVLGAPYASAAERAAWDAAPRALADALAPVLAASPSEPAGLVARYALGTDYHAALRSRLAALAADLRAEGIGVVERSFVDDRPLAERAFAARGGLGWIGKNTNLLTHDPAGSWLLLGELLLTDRLSPDEPLRSSCGACTRCLTGCPTGALIGPRTIDAGRCISYLTIEHPGTLTSWEAAALGDWIFGCDVCQEVCPVNGEADDDGPLRVPLLPLVEWLIPLGARAFDRAVGHTALRRAGRHRLLRNALTALANAQPAGPVRDRAAAAARAALADHRAEVRDAARRLSATARR